MSGRVGVEQTPDIEAALEAHAWGDDTAMRGFVAVQCVCGWTDHAHESDIYQLRARHDQHRAQALAPVLAAAVREARAAAWDEGYGAAEGMARCWGHTDHWEDEPENPYCADRIAVDAPEGGA